MQQHLALVFAAVLTVFGSHSVAQEMDYQALTDDPKGQMVVEFLDVIFNQGRVAEAFEKFVGDQYIQHNPNFASGPQAAIEALSGLPAPAQGAPRRYDVKRVLVDGDLVAVHSHVRFMPDGPGNAVVDIFRIEGDRIVEHWDVVQAVPENPANDNTMF